MFRNYFGFIQQLLHNYQCCFFVFLQRLLVVLEESLYIHNIRDMKVCLHYH